MSKTTTLTSSLVSTRCLRSALDALTLEPFCRNDLLMYKSGVYTNDRPSNSNRQGRALSPETESVIFLLILLAAHQLLQFSNFSVTTSFISTRTLSIAFLMPSIVCSLYSRASLEGVTLRLPIGTSMITELSRNLRWLVP